MVREGVLREERKLKAGLVWGVIPDWERNIVSLGLARAGWGFRTWMGLIVMIRIFMLACEDIHILLSSDTK